MKHIVQASMILICIVALIGCNGKATSEGIQTEGNGLAPSGSVHPELFEIVGKVTYKSMVGGFYAIEGDDGKKYDPVNLPEPFKKDGLKVDMTARLKKGAMGFHMYGAIIEIVNITAR